MMSEFDSVAFPDAPRLTREIWKATLKIDFDELDKWVVYEENDEGVVNALKLLEGFQKSRSIDSLARAGLLWRSENRCPLLEAVDVIHALHPTQEMRELFGVEYTKEGVKYPPFNSDCAQYAKCIGMSLCLPYHSYRKLTCYGVQIIMGF
jgi:hypothetical protein